MTRISVEEVNYVANLARLEVSEEEAIAFAHDLEEIISFAEQLQSLDTENVSPTTHVLPVKNVMRADEVTKTLTQEEVLKNAPDHKNGQIRVPSIIE